MDTISSSFRPWLSCQGICLLNHHQTGDTDSVQPVILLPVQRDSQETFIPCEARMLWYSADRTSSQQLRDTTKNLTPKITYHQVKSIFSGNGPAADLLWKRRLCPARLSATRHLLRSSWPSHVAHLNRGGKR